MRSGGIPRGTKGLTLIELMIVIGVVVILIALALPNLSTVRKRGNEARAQSKLKEIATAMNAYRDRWGEGIYPSDLCFLVNNGMAGKTGLSFSGTCTLGSPVTEAGFSYKVITASRNRYILLAKPLSPTSGDFAYAYAEDNRLYQNANGSSATEPSPGPITGIDTSGGWELLGTYASGR